MRICIILTIMLLSTCWLLCIAMLKLLKKLELMLPVVAISYIYAPWTYDC